MGGLVGGETEDGNSELVEGGSEGDKRRNESDKIWLKSATLEWASMAQWQNALNGVLVH